MSVDEVRQGDRLRGLLQVAQRSVTELRRGAETIEPVRAPERRSLVQRTRESLAWTRLPGLRPADAEPKSYVARLVQRFSLFVLLPTAVVAFYLFAIASDQYIAEAQFAVRGNVEPMENVSLGEYTSLIQKHNSQDSYIVRDFINSQAMVDAVEKSLGVSRMFSRKEADFWARYRAPQPIEELTKYWQEHVLARIDAISGVIQLSVRAFTPEDALAIAKDVIARSEVLINEISRRAQADMVKQAEVDSVASEERLRKATLDIQRYRNHWGIIDPIKSAESTLTTMMTLRKDKLKAENDLQVLRGSNLDEKSRSIQVLAATVAAIDSQMKGLQDQLTTDGGSAGGATMTNALLEYEGLMVERTIAEKLNEMANTILDKARVSAGKQHIFLTAFVPPMIPTDSLYPKRWHQLAVLFFCFVVLWSSVSLIVGGIRDQRI
ncbi:capsule biosynthesis protein [Methylobacterium sp. WL103]|uniref:capsule biosynthesis protein n=1 Tax=unclassified Methylobacterium TaxID=2615210 RepID=UPI0011C80BCC|nr:MULTISPECIES: capsule biosynthesis protein [unclassified Methylobacterium]TXM70820.1 capsule biosynthesis protein [Methylobacterium sp. WL120]TXM96651.1 capsule biosynthesis protein [Methylobacterium sp. WL103]